MYVSKIEINTIEVKMIVLSKLEENVLLTILKLKDNAYIVSIKDLMEEFTGKNISFGALYVALNRLIRSGYLDSFVGDASAVRGGRAKKFYRITKEGILVLKDIQKLQNNMWQNFTRLSDAVLESYK